MAQQLDESRTPLISRVTIHEPDDADSPRTRLHLNALHLLGTILDKREWWATWTTDPTGRTQWMTEIEASLVRTNVIQVLDVWPKSLKDAMHDQLTLLKNAAAMPNGETKHNAIEGLLKHVLYPVSQPDSYEEGHAYDEIMDIPYEYADDDGGDSECDPQDEFFCADGQPDRGDTMALDADDNLVPFKTALKQAKQIFEMSEDDYEGDDDDQMDPHQYEDEDADEDVDDAEDAEYDEDDEDDEEEYETLMDHAKKNAFAQIAWYVKMSLLREELRKIAPSDWTQETIQGPIAVALTRQHCDVVDRACALILAVVRDANKDEDDEAACSMASVKTHVPEEDRAQVLAILQLHFESIHEMLTLTKQDISNVLGFLVDHLALWFATVAVPGPVPYVWMSDQLIPMELKNTFARDVAALLENVPDDEKDWRAGSNEQLLDLVHPSLYCGVIGETPCLPATVATDDYLNGTPSQNMRAMLAAPATTTLTNPLYLTKPNHFLWIPCQIDVGKITGKATICTYINNLHPDKCASLYASIESIFTRFVPLFEKLLWSLDFEADARQAEELYQRERPCVSLLTPPGLFAVDQPALPLKGTRCQVIVKLTEIYLTPDKPQYPGGDWHNEGSDAERIIATGVYCFANENIATTHDSSRVAFRTYVNHPLHKPNDTVGIGLAYGLQPSELLVQNLGSVTVLEDRCVVYPNTYQCKIEPCRLLDPSKPGVRKILVFGLVHLNDPPVPLTVPQQREWIEMTQEPQTKRMRVSETVVPQPQPSTNQFAGLSLEEAKANRARLVLERRPTTHDGEDGYVLSLGE